MQIGTCKSQKGEITEGILLVGKTKDNQELTIPIKIAEGKTKGKTVFLSGGMHGDEINGVSLNHRFFHYFVENNYLDQLKGRIIFLPVLNPWGLAKSSREVSLDGRDLNRTFNQKDKEGISFQISNAIFSEIVAKSDLGIDMHDSGHRNILLPHSRVHQNDASGCTPEMGALFGTDIIMERVGVKGMMAIEAHQKFDIPVLTLEIGGGMVIWDDFIDRAVIGVKNILIYQGLLEGKITLPERQFFLTTREGHRAPISGVLKIKAHLGDAVEIGNVLAEMYDPITGDQHVIKAESCGTVFSRKMWSYAKKDESIISVMHFESCPVHGRKPTDPGVAKMIVNKKTDKVQVIESEVFKKAMKLRV